LRRRHGKANAVKLAEALPKKTEDLLNSEKPSSDNYLRIHDLTVDLSSGTVWRGEEVLDLPDLSFRLLKTLLQRAPAMVSKDDLVAEVWGAVVVSDETLMQRVRLLRQALGDDSQNPRYVASVRGRGYRLAGPVEVLAQPARSGSRPGTRRGLIGVAVVIVLSIAIALLVGTRDTTSPGIRTLAVLPFADLSEAQRFGFFADGMQEELLARLAALDEIAVLSRTSVERFRGTSARIPDIAAALEVDALIEGSVRLNDNQLRVTVQLIDGRSDEHLWAESYDEELTLENVFAIQERVANSIADAMQAELRRQQSMALGLPTADVEAYNLYLLGRYQTFRQTPGNLDLAVRYLERATELDPGFAEAYASLGWAYAFQGTGYGQSEPGSVIPQAREAALQALELDDRLADAHSLYADILTWYDWDFGLAEAEYRRTASLDPQNVLGYALFLSSQGRHEEALALVERRLAAAPDDDYVRINAGWNYLRAGRYADAIAMAEGVRDHPDAGGLAGYGYLASGDFDAALDALEDDLRRQGRNDAQLARLAYAFFRAGQPVKAQQYLDELEALAESRFVSPLSLASIYFAAGNDARGYEMLEAAVEARERGVIFLNVNRAFDAQRDDPRFIALVKRVGLPR